MRDVRIEIFNKPATLYRVGHYANSQGLWYDGRGEYTGDIHSLSEGHAAALPMDHHPVFRSDGMKWVSVTDTTDMLRNWFSAADMWELLPQGYEVLEVRVEGFRRLHFETYSHEVYCGRDLISVSPIDPTIVYPEMPV